MPEEVKKLIRDYRSGRITRREFMRRAVILTSSLAVADALIDSASPGSATAQVDPSDPAILWHNVEYNERLGQSPATSLDPRLPADSRRWF